MSNNLNLFLYKTKETRPNGLASLSNNNYYKQKKLYDLAVFIITFYYLKINNYFNFNNLKRVKK